MAGSHARTPRRCSVTDRPPSLTAPPEILRYGARLGGDEQQEAE